MSFRFKGGETLGVSKKKSKKSKKHTETNYADQEDETDGDRWIICSEYDFLKGPIIIMDKSFNILNHVGGTEKVSFKPPPHNDMPPEPLPPLTAAPWVGSQVFLAHPFPGNKFTIKSCFDKQLSCDKVGIVSCEMEAAGPCESWVIENVDGQWAFKTFWGTYLSVETDGVLRGDAEKVGPSELFTIKIQKSTMTNQVKKIKPKVSSADAEFEALQKFHSFGRKEIAAFARDTDSLARARKEGNLNEVLLERRAQMKKDKFC